MNAENRAFTYDPESSSGQAANNQISRARDTRDGNVWRTYVHDARGNVTSNNRIGFSYDRSDQPVSMWGIASSCGGTMKHNAPRAA